MTALSQYQRLEAPAAWHRDAGSLPLEVVVSLGDTTLTIADFTDMPLGHWSLLAVERTGAKGGPAVYRRGPDAAERLEIDDATMIAAIARVHRALHAPCVPRRRPRLIPAIGIAAFLVAMLW